VRASSADGQASTSLDSWFDLPTPAAEHSVHATEFIEEAIQHIRDEDNPQLESEADVNQAAALLADAYGDLGLHESTHEVLSNITVPHDELE
jgi:cation transport regulator ChaC